MPTPNDDVLQPLNGAQNVHATCPPDNERPGLQDCPAPEELGVVQQSPSNALNGAAVSAQDLQPAAIHRGGEEELAQRIKSDTARRDRTASLSQSPMPSTREVYGKENDPSMSPAAVLDPPSQINESSFTGSGFPSTRMRPNYSSSFLRAGSKFVGTQQSDKQIYNVEVSIKHVDMKESFVCGYLRIEELTKDNPTLTTYFEGEIIGPKYTFQTKHETWGATEKTDMQHWDRFPAWRPLSNAAKKPDFHYKNCTQRENMFMRWKEFFLVPNHRVREIMGASFEGFYYICFNQKSGTVSGIYFHAKSEKFQQLELRHVDDRGCLGSMEFR